MNITVIAIGKIKEAYFRESINEYIKRLSSYCSLKIVEIPSEPIFDEKDYKKYKQNEAKKILQYLNTNSYIITLEIEGKQLSSPDLAQKINGISNDGYNELTLIIGGANGLDDDISKKADFKLSFSKMTFTHQMIRVILLEQIYRAFKILNNENYHR